MAKRTKKSTKKGDALPETTSAPEASPAIELRAGIEDPIGDVSSGEAHAYFGDEGAIGEIESVPSTAERPENADESAADAAPEQAEPDQLRVELISEAANEAEAEEPEFAAEPVPPAKFERLQKILAQAGIASRRRAEELITEGRVQVNGTVVTELGSKANPERDHIRVDGKLLHGAERHRYFVLNKPKGYVTTVSDPEGRPTVMEFFEKSRERLYPVGRLDFQSEGLLLMTNDGELANQLTKAGSGVEKTYLVKVAGRPSEEELDRLRSGVAIEHGAPGSKKVHTAPARIQQVRQGENPWYEVVLIEGRNRELRKMFSAIGHFVEKIRRVGYGPLVLDVEPGKLRELTLDEVTALRLAAEGKLPKKAPRTPRTGAKLQGLPAKTGRSTPSRSISSRSINDKQRGPREQDRRFEGSRPEGRREDRLRPGDRAAADRPEGRFSNKPPRGGRPPRERDQRFEGRRFEGKREERLPPGDRTANRSEGRFGNKPPRGERPAREEFRPREFGPGESRAGKFQPRESRPGDRRTFGGRPDSGGGFAGSGRSFAGRSGRGSSNPPQKGRSSQGRPAWARDANTDRPSGRSGSGARRGHPIEREERGDRPPRGQKREFGARPFDGADRNRPPRDGSGFDRPRGGRPNSGGRSRSAPGRASSPSGRASGPRPERGSSGPRAGRNSRTGQGQPSGRSNHNRGFKGKSGGTGRNNFRGGNRNRG